MNMPLLPVSGSSAEQASRPADATQKSDASFSNVLSQQRTDKHASGSDSPSSPARPAAKPAQEPKPAHAATEPEDTPDESASPEDTLALLQDTAALALMQPQIILPAPEEDSAMDLAAGLAPKTTADAELAIELPADELEALLAEEESALHPGAATQDSDLETNLPGALASGAPAQAPSQTSSEPGAARAPNDAALAQLGAAFSREISNQNRAAPPARAPSQQARGGSLATAPEDALRSALPREGLKPSAGSARLSATDAVTGAREHAQSPSAAPVGAPTEPAAPKERPEPRHGLASGPNATNPDLAARATQASSAQPARHAPDSAPASGVSTAQHAAGAALLAADGFSLTPTSTINTPASGAPAISVAVPSPLGSPQWSIDFSRQLSLVAQTPGVSGQVIHMQLNPQHLGPVQITLHLSENTVQASFFSAHGAVRHALESALPQLEQQLEQSGLSLGQSDVSDHQNPQQFFAQTQTQNPDNPEALVFSLDMQAPQQSASTIVEPRRAPRPESIIDTFA